METDPYQLRLAELERQRRVEAFERIVPKRQHGARGCLRDDLIGLLPSGHSLLLWGNVGGGKSFQAAAAVWDFLSGTKASSRDVEWFKVTDLLCTIRASFGTDRDPIDSAASCKLLVLDDLGAERATDWVDEQLYTIVSRRYDEMLPLVVTTNFDPAALTAMGLDRVFSRMAEMGKIVHLSHGDRRLS